MRAAIIENGIVTNVIVADSLGVIPGLIDGEGAAIGDQWDGETFARPVPVVDLAALKAAAIAKAYTDVDAVTLAAVGERTEEYKDAEIAARAYRDAGYSGAVPRDLACYARSNPTNEMQSAQWAADEILVRADAYAEAKLQMREQRMDRQKDMRLAGTPDELTAAVAAWDGFIAELRGQLGL